MRTWRVGTFSMGASLLFLGIFLLLSQFFGMNLMQIMISWWPILLIVLGIEILLFLFLSKQEKPFLKYDFLSIFFVGVLGTIGIGFAVLSSTGIFDKVDDVLNREERTIDLPSFEHQINNDIKRVVINTDRNPLTIEGTTSKEISLFGTYRALVGPKEQLVTKAEEYVLIQEKGDTLYIQVKGLPSETVGPFDRYSSLSATILIPNDIKLEVNGNDNSIILKPRSLMSDWTIDQASDVAVQLQNTSDVKITATDIRNIDGNRNDWAITEETEASSQEMYGDRPEIKQAIFKTGQGKHHLQIMNSYQLNVSTVD
ncbi:hypothetical protein J2Z40_001483 [Cytobacillus eiseniae]|uniref:DUF5668 domain-containing protein n=1 Tax=Cytobacillus eiseniae TaxID=762947 RepID=A0ABS4RDV9_9BACI|nr:hypothetical protein [Cytobacillus eiseniae]MBP2240923.1 hypothetical protein [Cytobacillus eiseniae]